MPSQYITFRWEYNHRAANVPYFTGSGGVTPPGGNTGKPSSLVCLSGFTTCDGSPANTWLPDLRKTENRLKLDLRPTVPGERANDREAHIHQRHWW